MPPPVVPRRRQQPQRPEVSREPHSGRQFLVYQIDEDEQQPVAASSIEDGPFKFLDDTDEAMNPFSDAAEEDMEPLDPAATENNNPKPKGKDHTGTAREKAKNNILAPKSTNQRLRHPVPYIPGSKIEVTIPVKRPAPSAKRTRLSSPAASKPPGTPKTANDQSKRPRKPRRNKFRSASPSPRPLRRLSAGISMLSTSLGSPAASATSVQTQSKTQKKRPTIARGTSTVRVVPVGDVDEVIDPRNPPVTVLGSSPPAMAWLKGKASGVVSGARKAADRLLKTGGGASNKGYEPLDGEPLTQADKRPQKEKGTSPKIRSANKTRLDSRTSLEAAQENSFGELVDDDSSFNSFLLKDEQDELSLPNGSYVVNYDNGDTVITAAVTHLEPEPLLDRPLAQFTPKIRWRLKRKKGMEFLRDNVSEKEESDLTISTSKAVDLARRHRSLSVVSELDETSEGGSNSCIISRRARGKNPRGKTLFPNIEGGKTVVKKSARENLREPTTAKNGAGKVYGKRASKMSAESAEYWDLVGAENGHCEVE